MPGSLNWWREVVTAWCERNHTPRSTSQTNKIARRLHKAGVLADIDRQIAREVDRQIAAESWSPVLTVEAPNRAGSLNADRWIENKVEGLSR